MPRRADPLRLFLAVVMLAPSPILLNAAETPLASESHLIGIWMSADGAQTLTLRANRSAVREIVPAQEKGSLEVEFGSFTVRRAHWMLTLRDVHGREFTYGLVSHDPNRITLTDDRGNLRQFYRIGMRFDDLDKDGNGVLIVEEVMNTSLSRRFADYDANVNKQLDRQEYVRFWEKFLQR